MRTLIATALLAPSIAGACAQSACKRILSKKGTYVEPHYRSSPNSPVYDNGSTRGNVNPYTGEVGTRDYDGLRHYRHDRYDPHNIDW